ncbi:MAG: cadherin-like beta sandwich domain-containing protein [Angelakisella sp.]|nr:cadherin-like beta sandwich domain-containing protein [Angelakisella sp.]
MKFKRNIALAMSAAIFLSSPVAMAIPFPTPYSGSEITLSYIKSDINDPKTSTIVLGNSTTIKEQKPSGYAKAEPAFTVKAVGYPDTNLSNYVQIVDNYLTGTKDVKATGMPATLEELTYSIRGNYYAIKAEGDAYESLANWGSNTVTRIKSITPNAVMQYSEATIQCTNSETETKPPVFEFKDDCEKSGVFKDYANINVISSTKTLGKQKVLTFQLENNNDVKEFELYPQQTHIEVDQDGNVIDKNNYIKSGTTFRLVFRLSTSNDLFLRVLTPGKATENIGDEIQRNDGVINNSYIQLGSGDTLNFITQDFKLLSFVNQYGTFFNVDWQWQPTLPEDQDLISIASSGTWRDVNIYPRMEDRTGKLVAKVYYKKGQADEQEFEAQSIPILIRGTGTPASIESLSQVIGPNEPDAPYIFPDDQKQIPFLKKMDIYNGTVPEYQLPVDPYIYSLRMLMGSLNASSQYAILEYVSGDPDVVLIQTSVNDTPADYKFGDKIDNPKKNNIDDMGNVNLIISAVKEGIVKFQPTFYIKGNKGQIVKAPIQPKPITIQVYNTSPNDNATLKKLVIKDNNKKEVNFGFVPTKFEYDIEVPYSVEFITVAPTRSDPNANKIIGVSYHDKNGNKISKPLESGYTIEPPIELEPNVPNRVELKVTAQNPTVISTYILNIMRLPPSDDSSLKGLNLYNEYGKNTLLGFKSEVFDYKYSVPYSTKYLRVEAIPNHSSISNIEYTPPLTQNPNITFSKNEWLKLEYQGEPLVDSTKLTIEITAENNVPSDNSIYIVEVKREAPSADAYLSDLKVLDTADKNITYTPKFNRDTDTYELYIPYTTDRVKFSAKSSHEYATMKIFTEGKELGTLTNKATSNAIDVTSMSENQPFQQFIIQVTAEDGINQKEYKLNVTREEPNDDPFLSNLRILDVSGTEVDYDFFSDQSDYYINVPFETQRVTFVPTASFAGVSEIKVDKRKVENGKGSQQIILEYPGSRKVTVEVTAQDGTTKFSYNVTLTRLAPSSDARLKSLKVTGAEKFEPIFIANKTDYKAKVSAGAQGVNITATANHPGATIRIDGKSADSDKPTDLITLLDIKQTVKIVVTAQDGKTTMTYEIEFTNMNLIELTNNADLRDLKINYGAMTPNFKPSVTEYEVAASEETYSVDILPRAADQLATVEVFAGSKQIGDYYGNYSQAIEDGDNKFLIRVTSPDETKVKEYNVTVYRNEEDKMGTLRPIGPDEIDYERNPIIVDITKYSRVSAEVFNKLKEHPGKQIVFQGNDYSLSFNANDFKNVIPYTIVYDFGLTFTSPLEDEIWDEIESYSGNYYVDVVFVSFKHHGELPAKAKFTLSLGKKYASEKLYWHYYNEERERVDYYGYFNTNTRGTFTIPLYHMSTYMVVNQRLAGSEDKSNTNESANLGTSDGGKLNPDTGRDDCR